MSWEVASLIIFGTLLILMLTGMPVAIAFMLTCVIGAFMFWGGLVGLQQLALSYFSSISLFIFLPLPLFILMGSIIFESGVGEDVVNAVDKLLGRLPGRLAVLAISAGVLLGSMIGVSAGTVAILGKVLVPEMVKRGYKSPMSFGPVVGSGTLAVLIPPSALIVALGAIGKIPIGPLLMAIILPGLLVATLFIVYIVVRCKLQPELAPMYEVVHTTSSEKIKTIVFQILPIGIVIFAVIGVVFIGIATPTEAGALGVIGCYLLVLLRGKFSWKMLKNSTVGVAEVSVMIFAILISAISFSRILATSGAVKGLIDLTTSLPVAPITVIILTQIVILFLGCFLEPGSIIMITAPMFVPIASALGFDPVWYGVIMTINIQLGLITPPLGLDVFTVKPFAPSHVTLGEIFRASMPFCGLGYLALILIMIWPQIALWMPGLMSK
jgi:tripartite ATP-independent transporter DctM subunit